MKIRFAIAPSRAAGDLTRFGEVVQDLEGLGFDTVWLSDIPLGGALDPILGLAYAAARTSRLKLGANVVPFGQSPFTLAKLLAQLDQLSSGRLLLNFVVGLDQPGERQALGVAAPNRGRLLEEVVTLIRAWWAGETVEGRLESYTFPGVEAASRPHQDPLEIWFGGRGPAAVARAGRLADGWLGSRLSPAEAAVVRQQIQDAASEAGREIDPEHFGLSIPFAWGAEQVPAAAAQVTRGRGERTDIALSELVPVGGDHLRQLVERHVDAGLTKFVVRPLGPDGDGRESLARLAEVLLPLQS